MFVPDYPVFMRNYGSRLAWVPPMVTQATDLLSYWKKTSDGLVC